VRRATPASVSATTTPRASASVSGRRRRRLIPAPATAAARAPTSNNPEIQSDYTYLGQFIDHDITFDPVSSLQRQNDPDGLNDFRTPRFDLDSVYGSGLNNDPFLYDSRRAGSSCCSGRTSTATATCRETAKVGR